MKVLFVEPHYKTPFKNGVLRTSAVDWWRLVNPANYLKKNTDWEIEVRKSIDPVDPFSPQQQEHFLAAAKHFDVIYTSYFDSGLGYSWLHVLCEKFGTKLVVDIDDNIIDISGSNPVRKQYEENPDRFSNLLGIIENAPTLTTTTKPLKKLYKKLRNGSPVKILPNYIDLDKHKPLPYKPHKKVVIGYQGGITHLDDFYKSPFWGATKQILEKYKNEVEFRIFGFVPDSKISEFPNTKWIKGYADFNKYINKWKSWISEVDISVAPLEITEFNQGKSGIKVLEAGAASVPTIASGLPAYMSIVKNYKNGVIADTKEEWLEGYEKLINQTNARKQMGREIFKTIKNNYSMETKWLNWKELIETL